MINYLLLVIGNMGLYAVLAISLNLVVGYSGMLSLGHAGFLALGAYSVAILTVHLGHWNLWLALGAGAILTTIIAILLGMAILRLQGDYLAIASLGFAEILRSVFTSSQSLTRGSRGISGITGPLIGDTPLAYNRIALVLLIWVLVLLTYLCLRKLLHSRLGRAIEAVREDQLAAMAVGINPVLYKVIAFASAAFFAALAGGLWAINLTAISPNGIGNFNISVLILAMVVLGGMGNHLGAILGAVLLSLLDNLSILVDNFPAEISQIGYGLMLVLMMLYRPQGFLGRKRRQWGG